MAISGTGKAKRKSSMLFMHTSDTTDTTTNQTTTPNYELIGSGIEDLARELNNEVESKTDITGETEVELTKGAQITSVDPVKFKKDSEVSERMYEIYKNDLELSDVEEDFIEVFTEDVISEGEYAAFKQKGVIDLKSWGGDSKGINTPFDINWKGAKIYGTFNPTTKIFTPSLS